MCQSSAFIPFEPQAFSCSVSYFSLQFERREQVCCDSLSHSYLYFGNMGSTVAGAEGQAGLILGTFWVQSPGAGRPPDKYLKLSFDSPFVCILGIRYVSAFKI